MRSFRLRMFVSVLLLVGSPALVGATSGVAVASPVANSSEEMSQTMAALTAAKTAGAHVAAQLLQWGPDPITGRVRVGISRQANADDISELNVAFGNRIEITEVDASTTTSRENDTSPFYGGDRINGPSHTCTGGFGTHSAAGIHYLVTAGHCGSGTWTSGSVTVGNVVNVQNTNNGLDVEAIRPGSTAPLVFTGCLSCSNTVAIHGQYDPRGGEPVCFSGSFSLFACGATVGSIENCVYFGDLQKTTCHLAFASGPQYYSQPGDSGGPVLYQSAGAFYAAGTIVGNQSDISSAWFLPIKYTLSSMSLFLDTGA